MAELRATPMSNPILGLLADRLKKAQQFGAKPFGYENPPVEMLMNLLGVPAVQQTMERMAYGEPLTTGSGMTTKPRPEAIEAAMTLLPASVGLAKATKGLPVGASIKPINLEKGIYKADLTMEEMLKVRDIPTVERVQKSLELVGEKQFEKMVEAQFKKYKPSSPEQEAMLVESVTLQILGKAERSPFPRQEALDTAQRNAALPVEEGGLGLPKDNTPEMRAEAMGYKTPAYHGTTVWEAEDGRKLGDIEAFNRLASTEIVGRKPSIDQMGIWASDRPDASGAGMYSGSQGAIYPLMLRMENPKATSFEQMARTASNLSTNKALGAGEVPRVSDVEPYRQRLKEQGYDSLMLRAKEGSPYTEFADQTGYVLLEPSQVRSRFAAFDPKRRNEPDILAGVLPLGLLADEEQRKKLYELMPSLLGQ